MPRLWAAASRPPPMGTRLWLVVPDCVRLRWNIDEALDVFGRQLMLLRTLSNVIHVPLVRQFCGRLCRCDVDKSVDRRSAGNAINLCLERGVPVARALCKVQASSIRLVDLEEHAFNNIGCYSSPKRVGFARAVSTR